MSEEPNESQHSAPSSSEEEDEQSEKESTAEEESEADSSSEDESGSDADSLGPLNSERGSGESVDRKSSAGPKLGDFLDANRRKTQQPPADSGNRSLQQEIEAKRIAPQLADMVGQSMRDLNHTLKSLGLVDGEDIGSTHTSTTAGRESWNSDVTDTTGLRNQINAVDEGRLSINSTQLLLPPELRAMLLQQGLESTPTKTRRSLAVPPTRMMEASVQEEDEEAASASTASSSNMLSGTLPLESELMKQAETDGDDPSHEENNNDTAPSLGSSSPPSSPADANKPATPPPPIEPELKENNDNKEPSLGFSSPPSSPTDAHKSATPPLPPPLEPKLKIDEAESPEHDYTFLARIIFVFVICALVYAVAPAISGKSLPPVSTKVAEADGPSIRNSRTSGTPAARTQPSDDDLYDAFEALVGSDIYVPGSSQYLAAWWILEKDTRRHRATLERLEQRFLLAFFYFETTNNGETPWLSCNYELASSVPFTTGSRQSAISHGRHEYGSRTAPSASERGSRTSRSVESSCEFDRPLYDELGNLTGYTTTESFRWLSGHSECSWAGITCKHEDDSLQFDPVVEINLEGQMEYDTVVTEILQLPHLESLYY